MSTRSTHDPFTDAPLRPTTTNQASTTLPSNPLLRPQTSAQSLRSNASTTSTRTRPGARDLFAPSLTRRGTTPRFEDNVLADSDSEQDIPAQRHRQQTRRVRHGSPDAKFVRGGKGGREEEDFVNRKADGSYLLGVAGFGETMTVVPQMSVGRTEEEMEMDAAAAHDLAISRQYFANGAALGGKKSKKYDEELEQLRLPMMARLRQKVMQQLEDERWMYET